MVEFVMYIGLSGSGKSTLAKQYAEENTTENCKWAYMSSDNVRKLLYGDENCQDNPTVVFEHLNKATIECLSVGVNVVYDATNLSAKRRKALIARIRSACYDAVIHFTAIVVATPVGCCIERDKNRDRQVGERVILKQLCSFQVPTAHEGWNHIELFYNCDDYVRNSHAVDYIISATEMKHDNPHHLDTVWQHSADVADAMQKKIDDYEDGCLVTEPIDLVRSTGLLHDIGKVFTKTYDENGIAHYNGHDNASAYLSLLYPAHFSDAHILLRAAIIGWHMRHFSFNSMAGYDAWLYTLLPSERNLLELLVWADEKNSLP